jgi:hypothetical protein
MNVHKELLKELNSETFPVTNVKRDIASALGCDEAVLNEEYSTVLKLTGFHICISHVENNQYVAVYLITNKCLGVFHTNPAGESSVITINVARIRKVIRTETPDATNLSIEVEAGKYESIVGVDVQGNSRATILPTEYIFTETAPAQRESLRRFQCAISAALGS